MIATKRPGEAFTFTYDFAYRLAGATIAEILGVTASPDGLTKAADAKTDTEVLVFWQGGTAGTNYLTSVQIRASDGSILIIDGTIAVVAAEPEQPPVAGRWQQSDLDKIRAAISSGVRSITFADGRRTEYQSLDQLLAAEKVVETQLRMQARAAGSVVRRRIPYYRSGL